MRKIMIPLICVLLIIGAIVGAVIIVKTAPVAERKRPPRLAVPVDTLSLVKTNETVVLHLAGTVLPAKEVILRARVSGEITAVSPHFIEGGVLEEGSEILRIDPVDYELALADSEAKLEQARAALKTERGRQDVAKREWELLKTADATEQEKELALRLPQLATAEANLKAAEAALDRARLNLERTRIQAPFNAVVIERNVNVGSQVASTQDRLATLTGTDTYWVQVSIPVDRIEWVEIPGSAVNLISPSGAVRTGRVIKLLGDLEEQGRMARLLVEVNDPLCLTSENADSKPLLLGEYVKAEVSGRTLSDVFRIPRNALKENNHIWIANNDTLLEHSVNVLWRDAEQVLIRDGLKDGQLLIISDLSAPVPGMAVSTGQQAENEGEG